jgi:hypothetical protein
MSTFIAPIVQRLVAGEDIGGFSNDGIELIECSIQK